MSSNEEYFEDMLSLIDAWCDRRALRPLANLLPAYVSFNGLTDGWGELYRSLRNINAMHRDELAADEQSKVHDLIQGAAHALNR